MKKFLKKKEYLVIMIIVFMFTMVSCLSMVSIRQLQGNARVVNYVGIVRGATQKLIKEELMGVSDNQLIERLSSIVNNLMTGVGPHDLVQLNDESYLEHMGYIQASWKDIREEIVHVRDGEDPQRLFGMSQDYFELVNETVFLAEAYSEAMVSRTMALINSINIVFIVFIIFSAFFMIRGITISNKANSLDKIAYVDKLTQMDNRASCERLMERISSFPSHEKMAVIMFDMNGLKIVNDTLGHMSGDQMIRKFSSILKNTFKQNGFICRYGGDEFIAIIEKACVNMIFKLLDKIKYDVREYNEQLTHDMEKLSYASGYYIGSLVDAGIKEMISEADRSMLENKRKMKSNMANALARGQDPQMIAYQNA